MSHDYNCDICDHPMTSMIIIYDITLHSLSKFKIKKNKKKIKPSLIFKILIILIVNRYRLRELMDVQVVFLYKTLVNKNLYSSEVYQYIYREQFSSCKETTNSKVQSQKLGVCNTNSYIQSPIPKT